ncbi:hypothetical protein K504DRAFT_75279 [Pleomassaria siparia CBS 279.74]|uniref:Uncharacterized protein n=1 Tax=Pleomassaria siparia CBS 279.74 TaxID=1314801 RepID=A0A6G1JZZ8_9PLEO|nr:hypothetical protein K504DRAFT_75279 [Pleomassaria siparia CBS 279.74]
MVASSIPIFRGPTVGVENINSVHHLSESFANPPLIITFQLRDILLHSITIPKRISQLTSTLYTMQPLTHTAHELIGTPIQEETVSPKWRSRYRPAHPLTPIKKRLFPVPEGFVDDKIDVRPLPASKKRKLRYKSPHVLPRLPRRCAAPGQSKEPAGQFIPDHAFMHTDGLINNLDDIKTPAEIPDDAEIVDYMEARYDLNQLSFYHPNAEMFPDEPFFFNAVVVPEGNKSCHQGTLPIYNIHRIQTSFPNEAVHPDLAARYDSIHDGAQESESNTELPPRERLFLAKEGITSIVAQKGKGPESLSLKNPKAVRIQPKFLRWSTVEFEPLRIADVMEDDGGPVEILNPLAATQLEEFKEYYRAEALRRMVQLKNITATLINLEQCVDYDVETYWGVYKDLEVAVAEQYDAEQRQGTTEEEARIVQIVVDRFRSINERYTAFMEQTRVSYQPPSRSTSHAPQTPEAVDIWIGEDEPTSCNYSSTSNHQMSANASAMDADQAIPWPSGIAIPPASGPYANAVVKKHDSGHFSNVASADSRSGVGS